MRFVLLATLASCSFTGSGDPVGPATSDGGTDKGKDGHPAETCAVDVDHDGICDDVDPWLCGAAMPQRMSDLPPDESTTITGSVSGQGDYALVYNTKLAAGAASGMPNVSTTAGQSIALAFSYDWTVGCPNGGGGGPHFGEQDCQAQLVASFVPYASATTIASAGCPVDTQVSDHRYTFHNVASSTVTAPGTSGIYELRIALAKDDACKPGTGKGATIALVCIP